MTAILAANRSRTTKYLPIAIILALLVAAFFAWNATRTRSASVLDGTTMISQTVLEEKYGLRVNLIAVTAAGGMVDLRLKITDGEKAKSLLGDKKHFPALLIKENNVLLRASEETAKQEIKFEDNGDVFVLFPNSGNALKPGGSVIILFGDIAVEAINAQ